MTYNVFGGTLNPILPLLKNVGAGLFQKPNAVTATQATVSEQCIYTKYQ